ncbi:NaCl-inducible protein [Coccomyxa subellipsoidea C-169]|uniref:NaCl-inducible protein n=1 Tax=Coccomyxa subellipsoidea (strain C-169) TaxID=574566 RepID=I0YMB1_COCSC|nr:NaCl-inducible protein [Coccomyxa subellipsoidea C-169]EIE19530.1 NaCl-inducible protein [Coccomyxa subellipsoidea C-169]|eukprot:XP_005644074.1 NaCl-inducible protein [Coccomyxa subellipsoidea C-169]
MAFLQRVSRIAPTLRSLSAQRPAMYYISERSVTFSDREKGEELVHFRKEDEKLLRKLLEKVKAQADKVDTKEAEDHAQSELSKLKSILGNYNVAEKDLKALMDWKHEA